MVEELHHVNLLELNTNSPLFTNENIPTEEQYGTPVPEVHFEPAIIIPEESKIIDETPSPLNSVQRTLELNLQYQAFLREQLKRIEQALQRNGELQKKLRLFRTKSKSKAGKGAGHFVDQDGNTPPENPDAQRKQKILAKMPVAIKYKKWTKAEIKKLAQGVRELNQERMVQKLMDEFQATGNTNLDLFNKEMTRIRNMSEEELEKNVDDSLNWDTLAKRHIPGRTGIDCKIRWFNVDDPNIAKDEWTKEEDKLLLALAKEHQAHDWELIAREHGYGHTPLQCFRRYQRSLNTSMMKSKWGAEDDRILEQAVKRYGEKNWQQVANCIEGRTGQQCLHRWQKTLNPNIRRGRWTAEEDAMLTVAVRAYGAKMWIKVQEHVPGRTDVQCRERWVNILNPELRNGPWTKEEDQKLTDAIQKHGLGKWSAISHELYPRTDNQCWRRWKTLTPEHLNDYRENIYKKRKGLVNNFVGREKERPTLTPDDFEIDPKEAKKKKKKKAAPKKKRKTRSDSEDETEDDVDEESFDDDE